MPEIIINMERWVTAHLGREGEAWLWGVFIFTSLLLAVGSFISTCAILRGLNNLLQSDDGWKPTSWQASSALLGLCSFSLESRTVPFGIEVWYWHPQSRGEFQNFKIRHPADAAFHSGNHPTRNVPAFELADRSQFFLGPASLVAKQHDLAADNVTREIHSPIDLSGFNLAIVWNSKQVARNSTQLCRFVPRMADLAENSLKRDRQSPPSIETYLPS